MQKNAEVVSVQLGEFSQNGHNHVLKAQIETEYSGLSPRVLLIMTLPLVPKVVTI